MGWKAVKEHYRIQHLVHTNQKGICIGSRYTPEIIVIGRDGRLVKPYRQGADPDLSRYQREFDQDPELLRNLVETEDSFTSSVPVYTYDGATISEHFCEIPGRSQTTNCGRLMHPNSFSTDLELVVGWAKRNAHYSLCSAGDQVEDLKARLSIAEARSLKAKAVAESLNSDYPAIKWEPSQVDD